MRFVISIPFLFYFLTLIPQAAYQRLIWSMAENRLASCNRTVRGSLSYKVLGWSAAFEEVGFLMPMTFLNIFALVCVIMAMAMARGDADEYDPANIRYLTATRMGEHGKPKWSDRVRYHRGDVSNFHIIIQRYL